MTIFLKIKDCKQNIASQTMTDIVQVIRLVIKLDLYRAYRQTISLITFEPVLQNKVKVVHIYICRSVIRLSVRPSVRPTVRSSVRQPSRSFILSVEFNHPFVKDTKICEIQLTIQRGSVGDSKAVRYGLYFCPTVQGVRRCTKPGAQSLCP